MKIEEEMKKARAIVSVLPSYSGDGYGYGGGAIVSIGDVAIQLREGHVARKLAEEVARRWNSAIQEQP